MALARFEASECSVYDELKVVYDAILSRKRMLIVCGGRVVPLWFENATKVDIGSKSEEAIHITYLYRRS